MLCNVALAFSGIESLRCRPHAWPKLERLGCVIIEKWDSDTGSNSRAMPLINESGEPLYIPLFDRQTESQVGEEKLLSTIEQWKARVTKERTAELMAEYLQGKDLNNYLNFPFNPWIALHYGLDLTACKEMASARRMQKRSQDAQSAAKYKADLEAAEKAKLDQAEEDFKSGKSIGVPHFEQLLKRHNIEALPQTIGHLRKYVASIGAERFSIVQGHKLARGAVLLSRQLKEALTPEISDPKAEELFTTQRSEA